MHVCTQSCPTLCHPMDYSPPGFCVHGIFQERILERASFPPSGDLPDLGNQHVFPVSPALAADSLPRSHLGFPGGSAGKESACNAGDPGSISGSGRCPGEGTGYPLQYSWASLVAQMVKNLPAMRETWVRSLDWEDPLEEEIVTHSSILSWKTPWTGGPGRPQFMGSQRVCHDRGTKAQHST